MSEPIILANGQRAMNREAVFKLARLVAGEPQPVQENQQPARPKQRGGLEPRVLHSLAVIGIGLIAIGVTGDA